MSEVPGTVLSPVQVVPPSALNSIVPKVVGYPVNWNPKSLGSILAHDDGRIGITVAVNSSGLTMFTGVSAKVHPFASVTLIV